MRQWICLLLFVAISVSLVGCASDDHHDNELDQLWRQGYGFHNPNIGRMQKGQPPLSFDGTVYKP